MSSLIDTRLWSLAGLALLYSTIRFVEAYGLWRQKTWAEWLALAGGCIYLPFEVYEIYAKVTVVRVSALVFNLLIVMLMTGVLVQKRRNSKLK